MKKPMILAAAALSTVTVIGVVGVTAAVADPSPSATPSATASTPAAQPSGKARPDKGQKAKGRDLARRAIHGEVTLGGKKHRVIAFQRGTVTEVSEKKLTVRSNDGFVGSYAITDKTRVRVAKQAASLDRIAVGDRVRVAGTKSGKTTSALRINERAR